jgi:hypothetical protein
VGRAVWAELWAAPAAGRAVGQPLWTAPGNLSGRRLLSPLRGPWARTRALKAGRRAGVEPEWLRLEPTRVLGSAQVSHVRYRVVSGG